MPRTLSGARSPALTMVAGISGPPREARDTPLGEALRDLLEHVLRQARGGDDPLQLSAHQRGALGLETPPAAERRHQPGRDLRIELVGGEDHVAEEGVAAAIGRM